MRPILKNSLVVGASLLALFYAGDSLSVRYRMSRATPGDPLDVIVYPRLLAIPQKGNRVEYALDAQSPMESRPCVHSVFPHFGYTPCWYVKRQAQKPIPMVILVMPWRRAWLASIFPGL